MITKDRVFLHPQKAPAEAASPALTSIACPRCGVIDQPVIGPGSGPHTASARCRHCGAFLRWLSVRSPEEQATRRAEQRQAALASRPPSPAQLAYLAALGDSGPPPATMAEASQRIDARVRGEVWT